MFADGIIPAHVSFEDHFESASDTLREEAGPLRDRRGIGERRRIGGERPGELDGGDAIVLQEPKFLEDATVWKPGSPRSTAVNWKMAMWSALIGGLTGSP
ncbi:MAG: hypothetical protein IT167_29335 [Bryobacterales bacterium]|nr:hypothetical protein [Bryobacterales bacterium]